MNNNLMQQMWDRRAQEDALYYVESHYWNGNIDEFFALGEERAKLLIDPVIDRLPFPKNNANVLEIGCGVGRFSRALANRFSKVFAVDVSEKMVCKARELNLAEDYPNLEFQATDGNSIANLPDRHIDFVYSYEVFQHMPSAEVMLNNLRDVRRVLKPTGRALIHLRTEPFLSMNSIKKLVKVVIPESLWKLLGFKSFTFDPTWTGISLNRDRIKQLYDLADLEILEFIDDPTHDRGTRVFVLAKHKHS